MIGAILAALGCALFELAFFVSQNGLLPWGGQHAGIGLVFFAMHAAVALAAFVVARLALSGRGAFGAALAAFVPLATLIAMAGVSHFRERVYTLPRDVPGTLGTLAIAAVPFLAAAALARFVAVRGRADERGAGEGGAAQRVALWMSVAAVATGAAVAGLARGPEAEEPVTPRATSHTLQAADTGQRVLLFGFDGAAWDILEPMLAQGRLPNLAGLCRFRFCKPRCTGTRICPT